MSKNKKIILAAVAFLVVVAVFLTVYFVTRPEGTEGEKTFTVTVVHSSGEENKFTITSSEEFLAPALIEEGILTDEGIETGMYNTVDGETALWDPDQAYWGFYVDGEYAMQGMNTTPIVDGANYKLEYTSGNYGG